MEPHPNHPQARDTAPKRCRRCPSRSIIRLTKTRRRDNDVYRCARCGFVFSSGNLAAQPTQQHVPQPKNPAVSKKRTPKDRCTNFSEISYEKTSSSYDRSAITEKKQKFLLAYQLGLTVEQAARFAGVSTRTAYYWRDKDPDFAQDWRNCRDRLVEGLEMQAFQRAAKGNDRMLTFLLKSYKPETYNQRPSDKAGQSQGLNIADLVDKVRQWA